MVYPKLTTSKYDYESIAADLVNMLQNRITNPYSPYIKKVYNRIIVERGSTKNHTKIYEVIYTV